MRVVTLESRQKACAVMNAGSWSSSRHRSLDWATGERVVVLVARTAVLTAMVSGPRVKSDAAEWASTTADWNVPLIQLKLLEGDAGRQLNEGTRAILRDTYGEQVYFRILLLGTKLGDGPERRICKLLEERDSR